MKKFLSLLLATIMLLSLCACGGSTDDIRGETVPQAATPEETPEYSFGKTTGNLYKNDFLGMSCELPADWVFYTEQQLLEMNNIAGEYVDEDTLEQLKNATIIYDMYASDANFSSITVNLEKFNLLQMATLDIKASLEGQKDGIISSYQSMGYSDIQVEYQKITVDGQEYDGLVINASIQGISFYAKAFAFKKGNYLANVTVSSVGSDATDTILGYIDMQ